MRHPIYLWVGVAVLTLSQAAMLLRIEPFWSWHTPIAWTAYILIVDAIIYRKRGSSWLTANRGEFAFLAAMSIPMWLVFEAYNLLIRNWYYINLPENMAVRYFGYAWAFATISPGIFQTAELAAVLRRRSIVDRRSRQPERPPPPRTTRVLVALGAATLVWPVIWPSPYLAAPVFLGFIFLLDPLNARAGDESLLSDLRAGASDRLVNLLAGGFVCGGLWEFWNYWARAKWIYTVPIFGNVKIFEMPVLGYFGFPPFALECLAMYVFIRRLVWRGSRRPIAV